jgi:hypothetical protein
LTNSLEASELERVAAQYNAAVQRIEVGEYTHSDLRRDLDQRNSGTNYGLYGASTPQERAATLGSRVGGREIERNGGLYGDSVGPAPARADMRAAWEAKNMPAFVRQQAPTGSSGDGWVGVDN